MKPTLILLTIFAFIFSGCASPSDPNILIETDKVLSLKKDDIVFTLTLSKTQFDRSESMSARFEVSNNSQSEATFNFANVQQLGYRLINSSETVVLFQPLVVAPALSSFKLAMGEIKTFEVSQSLSSVPVGKYRLEAYLLDNNSPTLGRSVEVN